MSEKNKTAGLEVVTPKEEAKRLRLEKARLEVEVLREQVQTAANRRAQRADNARMQQRDYEAGQARAKATQAICTHKKGGKDLGGIVKGDGLRGGYAVNTHIYPNGDPEVRCSRCYQVWVPPGCAMQKACYAAAYEAQKNDPAERARQLAAFREASSWPTDNSPSGSQMFLVRHEAAATSSEQQAAS